MGQKGNKSISCSLYNGSAALNTGSSQGWLVTQKITNMPFTSSSSNFNSIYVLVN